REGEGAGAHPLAAPAVAGSGEQGWRGDPEPQAVAAAAARYGNEVGGHGHSPPAVITQTVHRHPGLERKRRPAMNRANTTAGRASTENRISPRGSRLYPAVVTTSTTAWASITASPQRQGRPVE